MLASRASPLGSPLCVPSTRAARSLGRRAPRVVAMGRRSKKRKDRQRPNDDGSSGAPASAPATTSSAASPPAPPPTLPRGPERLSAKDWAEIDAENERSRASLDPGPGPGPAGTGLLDKALGADAMLLFAVDGAVPEVVNGRVAMFGFVTALIVELTTGRSFTTQLAYNLTHGVSFTIIGLVVAGTLAPCVMADPKETPFEGEGIAKYRREPRAKAGRQYLCDPRAVDCEGLPGKDTMIGRVGFGPLAETWNGRAAMVGLVLTFMIEGSMRHGIFRG